MTPSTQTLAASVLVALVGSGAALTSKNKTTKAVGIVAAVAGLASTVWHIQQIRIGGD